MEYQEGVFVGYRYYTTKEMEVLFPFGHGLSYTKFFFSDLKLDKNTISAKETLTVTVRVSNIGPRAGRALVQLYVGTEPGNTAVRRPVRELRRFQKVALEPGESRTAGGMIS